MTWGKSNKIIAENGILNVFYVWKTGSQVGQNVPERPSYADADKNSRLEKGKTCSGLRCGNCGVARNFKVSDIYVL